MLFYRLCLIALVVGVTSGKDSGGEEEEDEEQNFSISIEDFDGVQIEVIDRQQEELEVARPRQHVHLHIKGQVCGRRHLLLYFRFKRQFNCLFMVTRLSPA